MLQKKPKKKVLSQMFNELDLNQDGVLDKSELWALILDLLKNMDKEK